MDAPDRLVLRGGRISAGNDSATVTFTAPVPRLLQPVPLHVEGTAVIGGHDVTHSAVPADDMMQAFAYHHLVPAHELVLDVLPRGQALPIAAVSDTSPLWLIPGGVTQLRLAGVRGTAASQLEFVLQEAPEGISIEDTKVDAEGVLISIRADAAKVKPGLKGSIILAASRVTTSRKSLADPTLVKRLQPLGILPAVAFDAVAR
jgi:hypothetical protein